MNRSEKVAFLEKSVELLVEHFGADRVRAAVAKFSNGTPVVCQPEPRNSERKSQRNAQPSVKGLLEQVESTDRIKHQLLTEFYSRLQQHTILPEAHDIRHFVLRIGLPEARGRSRREMISSLMRLLLEQPTDVLRNDLAEAEGISEHQRRQGYSMLVDHLMGQSRSTVSDIKPTGS